MLSLAQPMKAKDAAMADQEEFTNFGSQMTDTRGCQPQWDRYQIRTGS